MTRIAEGLQSKNRSIYVQMCVTCYRDSLDTSSRGSKDIELLSKEQDQRTDEENDSRKEVGQPESDVFLRIDHTDLPDEGTDVDEQVEVHEQTGGSEGRIDDDSGPVSLRDNRLLTGDLLGNQGGYVTLESTGTETHDDKSDNEETDDSVLLDDSRNGTNSQEDVSDQDDDVGQLDGLVTTKVLIGQVGSQERSQVDPESVEGGQTESSLLTGVKGSGLTAIATSTGTRARGKRSLDEVLW
jgi:hypothetical protein